MILDNGVIRTLDPSLPTCGALAIAGPIVAGGVVGLAAGALLGVLSALLIFFKSLKRLFT